ncbi:hypothetical protein ACFY93_01890 [Streptomyces sp. NPDC008313]|uniref:hypothetical protein n=1 Tax=Streptomyces sp. NPDC008313 TaxID=3364826 RepID=UPI0036EEC807
MSRVAVAVSVVAALGFTAACGGDGDKDGESSSKPAKTAGSTASKDAGDAKETTAKKPALTEAQLNEAALADGDVKGYKVEKMPAADMPAASVPATPATCQPLADMFFFTSDPAATDRTGRTLAAKDQLDATVTSLALLAHDDGDAEKVMAGLRTATEKCKSYEHTDYKYSDVQALEAPEAGDEAVAYKLKGKIEGTTIPMAFTIVRSGSTLAGFYSMNALDAAKAKIPADVIEAQVAKLEKLAK